MKRNVFALLVDDRRADVQKFVADVQAVLDSATEGTTKITDVRSGETYSKKADRNYDEHQHLFTFSSPVSFVDFKQKTPILVKTETSRIALKQCLNFLYPFLELLESYNCRMFAGDDSGSFGTTITKTVKGTEIDVVWWFLLNTALKKAEETQ